MIEHVCSVDDVVLQFFGFAHKNERPNSTIGLARWICQNRMNNANTMYVNIIYHGKVAIKIRRYTDVQRNANISQLILLTTDPWICDIAK